MISKKRKLSVRPGICVWRIRKLCKQTVQLIKKSIKRVKEKIRFITSRSNAWSMEFRYLKLRQLIIGWVSYFRLADIKTKCQELDVWTRRRIRMCYLKTMEEDQDQTR